MFVFLVCLVLAACHCEASGYIGSGIYGIDGSGLYNNYDGAYAASYRNYKPYAFEYGVSDPYTGDHKSQWETKDQHGTVRGSYSLLEPDGSTRIVDYIADDNGFRAIVKKIGIHGHPLSVESHGGAESGHSLLQNPIVVAEPSLPAPAPALPLPQPALHVPAPVLAPTPIPVPTHVPITPQFVVNNQEAVVRQPAVYIEEGPVFQSYDGGIRNYQNLIPVPKAQGVYSQQPVFQAAPEINLQQSYVQQPVLAPTAAGISQGGYVIPQERYPDSYQQQVYQAPAEVRTYQNVPSYPVNQAGVSYDQRLPEVTYQAPIEQSRVSVPEYPAYEDRRTYSEPIQSNQIAPPASDVGGPVSSYQFEQTFGDPGNLVATQPKYYGQPESISSQNYVGSTGNIQDDREYVNYDISYEDQGYKQPLPYRSKRDSDK